MKMLTSLSFLNTIQHTFISESNKQTIPAKSWYQKLTHRKAAINTPYLKFALNSNVALNAISKKKQVFFNNACLIQASENYNFIKIIENENL